MEQLIYDFPVNCNTTFRKKSDFVPKLFCNADSNEKRVNRAFMYSLIKNKFKNNHNNGLYDYIALICHACTYYRNGDNYNQVLAANRMNAYVFLKTCRLKKILGYKTITQCWNAFVYLKSLKLIDFFYDEDTDQFTILLLHYKCNLSDSWEKLIHERISIYKNKGYVLVKPSDLEEIYENERKCSDRDKAVDLLLHIILNDPDIGSKIPVVYFRGPAELSTMVSYKMLAARWECSVGKAYNFMQTLQAHKIVELKTLHKNGVYIYMPIYQTYLLKAVNANKEKCIKEKMQKAWNRLLAKKKNKIHFYSFLDGQTSNKHCSKLNNTNINHKLRDKIGSFFESQANTNKSRQNQARRCVFEVYPCLFI